MTVRSLAPRGLFFLALGTLAPSLLACSSGPDPILPTRRDAGPPPECRGVEAGRTVCEGTSAILCATGGVIERRTECADRGELCVSGLGCALCAPGTISCDGETVVRCNADGTVATPGETCDVADGQHCSVGGCARLCEQAETERSYIGCEYIAAPTTNSEVDSSFSFAVAIANPQLVPAEVTITRGAGFTQSVTVAPGALETVRLPWVESLRRPFGAAGFVSVAVPDGSYRVRSSVPITAHQFNPLTFLERADCTDAYDPSPGDGQCHSYTNDASLLLPVHALTGSYLVMSRASHLVTAGGNTGGSPGFVAIVGADTVPSVVTVRTRAHLSASADGAITEHAPGDSFELTIAPGEVVQLVSQVPASCPIPTIPDPNPRADADYCRLGEDYDLTGSEIVSSQRVAVFSGHNCTFVPFDRWACDHLEEQMFPAESLGTSAVAPLALQQRSEPNLLRVVSASDGNTITFSPVPEDGTETVMLDRGDHVEVEILRATRVTGERPILAARFLVGQDWGGIGTAGSGAPGDPSMGLLVPDQQWRNQYVFLAPDTYTAEYIDVIAVLGARVELDGQVIGSFREAVGTGVNVATVNVRAGVHRLVSPLPIGVHVYGYASYTSYLAPGGLDLREIADPL